MKCKIKGNDKLFVVPFFIYIRISQNKPVMLKTILLFILIIICFNAKSEIPKLTEHSKAVLFTCEPGDELYAGFGHSALWISDLSTGVDRLYSYGTFDFNTPNFYVKFIRGKLKYMVTVTTVSRFINEYNYRKIGVKGQQLNLKLAERQRLFDLLEENLLPENRFYMYDFFYDNCATRIRDIVEEAVEGEINFNTEDQNITLREMLLPFLEHTPWTKFGINLILGLSSDKIATPYEYMYLPDYMEIAFGNAIIDSGSSSRKLVKSENKYLNSKLEFKYNILSDPALLFGALFLLIGLLTFIEIRTRFKLKWLDLILNSIAVLAGLFLFFMWVGTDHSATNQNLNILWLLPAQGIFLISCFYNETKRKKLIKVSFIITVIVSFAMYLWPQNTELSFLIITLIFAFRYLMKIRRK